MKLFFSALLLVVAHSPFAMGNGLNCFAMDVNGTYLKLNIYGLELNELQGGHSQPIEILAMPSGSSATFSHVVLGATATLDKNLVIIKDAETSEVLVTGKASQDFSALEGATFHGWSTIRAGSLGTCYGNVGTIEP